MRGGSPLDGMGAESECSGGTSEEQYEVAASSSWALSSSWSPEEDE
jgi:hypothetical protein